SGRIAIVWRPALQYVRNENAVAAQADRAQHFVQQLSRAADEGFATAVLFDTGRLADDHPLSCRVAHTEHRLGATFMQNAAGARRNSLPQFGPAGGVIRESRSFTVLIAKFAFGNLTCGVAQGEHIDTDRIEVCKTCRL